MEDAEVKLHFFIATLDSAGLLFPQKNCHMYAVFTRCYLKFVLGSVRLSKNEAGFVTTHQNLYKLIK
jgi:hypothetical protein